MAENTTDDTASTAVEAPDLEATDAGGAPKHGFFVRLYTGTGAFEVIGKRKLWYAISGLIVLACIASIALKGFVFGIDFEGGTKVAMPVAGQMASPRLSRSRTSSVRHWAGRRSRSCLSAMAARPPCRSVRRR